MYDIKKVIDEAEAEVQEESLKKAKERIKGKIKEREQAKKVLANVERELADLYAELSQDA